MITRKKPDWLKINLPKADEYSYLKQYLKKYNLHTICESGNCPNIGECWNNKIATFMILGDICTRSCRFCAVKTGKPLSPDPEEPMAVAQSVKNLNLRHCVLTSVDRDDLEDGGADIWVQTIRAVRELNPGITIETLIPDFNLNKESLNKIIKVKPDIVSHNLETVSRLTKLVRIRAQYNGSLEVISYLKKNGMTTKSGIMTGLGETDEEITETMKDLVKAGCDIFTIGQYLQPSFRHLPVERYVDPIQFEMYKKTGLELGFKTVESGPLVRSSYHAEKHLF